MLDRFFIILYITPSFLVRFLPVKYRIEALNVLHALVRGWSIRSSFRSGQWFGQTWSTLVKLGQGSPSSGKCIPDHVLRIFGYSGPQLGQERLGQTWSTLVKLGQSSPNSGKCILDHVFRISRYIGPQSGRKRLGQTLIKLGQLLVKLNQPRSNLGKLGRISGNAPQTSF